MQLVDAIVRNPVKVAVGVLLVALFGLVALTRMPMQLTPEVQTPTITIETRWPGASPQEIEQEIVLEQEEQLKGVEGVQKMTSESKDSVATITLEFSVGTDMQKSLVVVNSRLGQVSDYPENADKPVISTANASDRPIGWFILSAKPPSVAEIREFQQQHPQHNEALEEVINSQNVGVAMLRLRRLLKQDPQVRMLLPARMPNEQELVAFQRSHPELEQPLKEVLDMVRGNQQQAGEGGVVEGDAADQAAASQVRRNAVLERLKALAIEHDSVEQLIKLDVQKLRRFAEDEIEAPFERVPGISQSNVIGGLEDEMQVIVDPEKLAARNLTIGDVRDVLRSQNADTSAGDYWEGMRRNVTRTLSKFRSPEQVGNQLLATFNGAPVYVRDVAEVRLGYKKPTGLVRRFGESSIAVNTLRETGANVLEVMVGLRAEVDRLNTELLNDRGLQLVQVYDETDYIFSSVNLVQQNIFVGGALTMIVLMGFLHLGVRSIAAIPLIVITALCSAFVSPWFFVLTLAIIVGAGFWFARGALVVGLAIPTSIIGTFLILGILGRSLNVVSLAGMAFAVGMLVDNAVVVLENIYRRYSLGEGPLEAATKGTQEVLGAIVSSTLTTIAVFLPIVFVQEEAGQLFRDIALAITAAVSLSLLVSMTLIPTASARLFSRRRVPKELPDGEAADLDVPYADTTSGNGHASEEEVVQSAAKHKAAKKKSDSWLDNTAGTLVAPLNSLGGMFIDAVVGLNNWVQRSIVLRVAVVAVTVLLSIGLSYVFWPKVEYLPSGNRNLVFGILIPPPGYNLDKMQEMGETVETTLKPYWDVDPNDPAAQNLDYPIVGDFFFVARDRQVFMGVRAHDPARAVEMVELVRKAAGEFPGTIGIAKQSSLFEQGLSAGRTIEIEITGPDLEKLVTQLGPQVFGKVKGLMPNAQIRPIPSLDLASPETHIEPYLVQAAEMGVNSSELGYTVNALVDGAYAGDYLYQGDKIDLTIIGEQRYAQSYQDVENLPVATPIGEVVPLRALAEITLSSGPEQVNHRERVRAVTIEVSPPPEVALEDAMVQIRQQVVAPLQASGQLTGGYRINLAGTADKLATMQTTFLGKWTGFNAESFISIMTSQFVLVILITYLLMAALFESWLYPLVIIVSVPLGAVGGILGLNLLNVYLAMTGQIPQQLDVLTMLGFVILIGTVVNNPILIVHQSLNHMREDHMAPRASILESVRTRIRPIFMTTTTTVLGLLPLVLFPGSGSELYRGLGSVVLGGLIVSTLITLILVPTLFSLTMDIREAFVGNQQPPVTPPQPVQPPRYESEPEPVPTLPK